jgi:hypothetical protein
MTELRIVCCWCGKDMGTKDGKGQTGTTHSICNDCFKEVKDEGQNIDACCFDFSQFVAHLRSRIPVLERR